MRFCQQSSMSQRNNSFACNSVREIKDVTSPSFKGKAMRVEVGRLERTKSVFQSCLHSTILKIPFPRLLLTSLLSNLCFVVLLTFSLKLCFFNENPQSEPSDSSFFFCLLWVFFKAHVYGFILILS